MKLTKIALAFFTVASITACSGSNKEAEAPKNEQPVVEKSQSVYKKGDGKTSLSYIADEKKELTANTKYGFFKLNSFVNNANDAIRRIEVNGKDFTKLAENLFLVDENLELGLADYKITYNGNYERFTKRIYNQPYSINTITIHSGNWGKGQPWVENMSGINPDPKSIEAFEKAGNVFTYKGKAFTMDQDAKFSYTVDFGKKVGSGQITGLNYGDKTAKDTIHLKEAALTDVKLSNLEKNIPEIPAQYKDPNTPIGFRGKTDLAGNNTYLLELKGPNAEEVIGTILKEDKDYAVYSPTQDWNNTTEFNGRVAIAGCRDSELCQ
ncbi:factor H binding protein domain-containing protein [Ursidibacter sp. B-7004-1]